MLCLGIETTAHTFGCAVVREEGGRCTVLSNERMAFSTQKGGMLPREVADHHATHCDRILADALAKASVQLSDLDLISFSQSPGIGHMLRIGCMFAKALARLNGIPLVGVNHSIAHLEIGRALTGAEDPVMLYASGANTQVIAFEGGRYRVFGETLDVGVGNFLDTFARYAGLGFPGGPKIYEHAKGGAWLDLPYRLKGMDVAFSGLLTEAKRRLDRGEMLANLCYSIQELAFAELLEASERAMAHCGKKELLLAGGVACNVRLQEMAGIMCKERGAKLFVPERQYLIDNAAMIAWQGILQKDEAVTDVSGMRIEPYLRVDDFDVTWRAQPAFQKRS